MKIRPHKIGAIFYILWGVIHIMVGGAFLHAAVSGGVPAVLALSDVTVPTQEFPGLLRGLLAQHGWNIVWAGLVAATVGATMNWRNSRAGYWANLVVVSAFELGLVFAVIVPGHVGLSGVLIGPIIWVMAVVFSTLGIRATVRSATRTNS